jgi:hypothetical protein
MCLTPLLDSRFRVSMRKRYRSVMRQPERPTTRPKIVFTGIWSGQRHARSCLPQRTPPRGLRTTGHWIALRGEPRLLEFLKKVAPQLGNSTSTVPRIRTCRRPAYRRSTAVASRLGAALICGSLFCAKSAARAAFTSSACMSGKTSSTSLKSDCWMPLICE